MTQLYWHSCGTGKPDLVLLHGWGMNAQIWHCMQNRLAAHFRVHVVDLPGYGRSSQYGALSLSEVVDELLAHAPRRAFWLGWSMGGLVACQIALRNPERVCGIITVSSSPCFLANGDWPGIHPQVLDAFAEQLYVDYERTVERFLSLQIHGIDSARKDLRLLKSMMFKLPMPAVAVMTAGLDILRTTDLRVALAGCTLPFLRIYGRLDGLVPWQVAQRLDNDWPQTRSVMMHNTAHAPFISHPDDFSTILIAFLSSSG